MSFMRRQLARGNIANPSIKSHFKQLNFSFRADWNATAPARSISALIVNLDIRRFSSDDSSRSSSISSLVTRVPQKDEAGWKVLSSRLNQFTGSPMWLIPRKGTGFDSFLRRESNDENKKEEERLDEKERESDGSENSKNEKNSTSKNGEAKDLKEPKEDEDAFSSFRSKYEGNKKRKDSGGNGGNGVPPNFNSSTLMLSLVLVGLSYFILRNDDGNGSPNDLSREITWNDFCNYLLETGQVEKIVVTNNRTIAKVFLKRGPHGLPQHQNRQFRYSEQRNQGSIKTNQMFDDSTTQIQDGYASGSSTESFDGIRSLSSGKTNQHQIVYRFAIGSIDSFEKKLEEAQKAVGIDALYEIPVQYTNESTTKSEVLGVLPSLILMGAAFYFMRFAAGSMGGMGGSGRGGGGMGGMFQVGKSTHKKIKGEDVKINFSDVAGCDEAKKEIVEFVEFLQSPEQFTKLGAKIPKGALLCGPPGTGKTLLAKAVAGEAGVPFFSISGSDFIEMFVGVGPSRVRDLFKEARENAPCIIFIDEIDAVGRQRGRGGAGGNDERENTLNQMLVEMDGFDTKSGVVVLAGTNRVDILDQALTRPGRFDRQITVDIPDLKGRKEIFKVHLKGITLKDPIDDIAGRLAGLTPGFAGADIANICNEAAIVAARRRAETVEMDDFEKATDRIIGGLESNKIMNDEERSIVAYHEAGHAIAGWFLEHADPLLKVTIIPRTSGALGFAQYLPKEVNLRTQEEIMDIVCMALAGRAAEEIFFGKVTTGASDDLRRVTDLVYSTIQLYGMNPRLGQLAFPKDENAMFDERPYSEKTAKIMDEEARIIVNGAYERTLKLLRERKDDVEAVAKLLLEKETIVHDDVHELVGPRPFKGDPQYEEFIRRHRESHRDMEENIEQPSASLTPE